MSATPWIESLRRSHERLAATAAPLTEEQLTAPSYDTEWSVAQVLSHLGSGAEIFELIAEAGVAGTDAPGVEQFHPIWDRWNAKPPVAMRDDALVADATLVATLEALTPEQGESFRLALWGMDLGLAEFVRMRLGEHAVHTWDVAVSFDGTALVAADAVALLLPGLGQLASRAGTAQDPAFRVRLATTDGHGDWVVEAGDPVALVPAYDAPLDGVVRLPAEALLRLVYGRLDPAHTPSGVTASGTRGLDDLRPVFPGF